MIVFYNFLCQIVWARPRGDCGFIPSTSLASRATCQIDNKFLDTPLSHEYTQSSASTKLLRAVKMHQILQIWTLKISKVFWEQAPRTSHWGGSYRCHNHHCETPGFAPFLMKNDRIYDAISLLCYATESLMTAAPVSRLVVLGQVEVRIDRNNSLSLSSAADVHVSCIQSTCVALQ